MLIYDLIPPGQCGTSAWMKWLGCPLKAMREELEAKNHAYKGVAIGTKAQQIGTLGHAYLSLYHTGTPVAQLESVTFRAGEDLPLDVWGDGSPIAVDVKAEALRIALAWADTHSSQFFGSVNHAEVVLGENGSYVSVTGNPDLVWSGRADLVSTTDDGQTMVVDWKFLAALQSGTREYYQNSLQLKCYMMAVKALGKDVVGGRYVLLIKRKEPHFEIVEVPYPSRREEKMIWKTFEHIAKIRQERRYEVNINECFGAFGNVCRFFSDGSCQRYAR